MLPDTTSRLLGLRALRLAFVAVCAAVVVTISLVLSRYCVAGAWCKGHHISPDTSQTGSRIRSYTFVPLQGKCEVPQGGFTAWKQGVVSRLEPEVAVNCSKARAGDKAEVERVGKLMSSWKNGISDGDMQKKVRNCTWLRNSFDNNLYNSELEKSFPLAFTLVVYNNPQQVLRLLRLLYRPQNTYCIHYDSKSEHKEFFHGITECFHNMIVPSKLERVVWSHYSILGAQMNCMKELLHYRTSQVYKWKYVINICGKELPLITTRELVSRLMKLNGSSSIKAFKTPNTEEDMSRIKYRVKLNGDKTNIVVDYKYPLGKPPFDVSSQYYKSEAYVIVSHSFATFLTTNTIARKVHRFFKNCKNPEEHFYATMYRWPNAPGGYNPKYENLYIFTESVFWNFAGHRKCRELHKVCITSLDDLHEIVSSKLSVDHVFHNKYFMDYDHTIMQCMERDVVETNKLEFQMECSGNNSMWLAS